MGIRWMVECSRCGACYAASGLASHQRGRRCEAATLANELREAGFAAVTPYGVVDCFRTYNKERLKKHDMLLYRPTRYHSHATKNTGQYWLPDWLYQFINSLEVSVSCEEDTMHCAYFATGVFRYLLSDDEAMKAFKTSIYMKLPVQQFIDEAIRHRFIQTEIYVEEMNGPDDPAIYESRSIYLNPELRLLPIGVEQD